MSRAVKCPVCNGTGVTIEPFKPSTTRGVDEKVCHGCNGKGWVEIN